MAQKRKAEFGDEPHVEKKVRAARLSVDEENALYLGQELYYGSGDFSLIFSKSDTKEPMHCIRCSKVNIRIIYGISPEQSAFGLSWEHDSIEHWIVFAKLISTVAFCVTINTFVAALEYFAAKDNYPVRNYLIERCIRMIDGCKEYEHEFNLLINTDLHDTINMEDLVVAVFACFGRARNRHVFGPVHEDTRLAALIMYVHSRYDTRGKRIKPPYKVRHRSMYEKCMTDFIHYNWRPVLSEAYEAIRPFSRYLTNPFQYYRD